MIVIRILVGAVCSILDCFAAVAEHDCCSQWDRQK